MQVSDSGSDPGTSEEEKNTLDNTPNTLIQVENTVIENSHDGVELEDLTNRSANERNNRAKYQRKRNT